MVFPSVPVSLDPPHWQQITQQLNHQLQGGSDDGENFELTPPPMPPLPPAGGGGMGSIRSGSMGERARLAKLPQPEGPLKCPRCESTNTKFCYFNNYSLSQPRHFCKTCRRYWTRGGILRNVPVGGRCRINKRSKMNKRSSKSLATTHTEPQRNATISTTTDQIMHHLPPAPQYPFLHPNLHHFSSFGATDIVPNFEGIQPPAAPGGGGGGFVFDSEFTAGAGSLSLSLAKQFALISGLEPQTLTGIIDPSINNQLTSKQSEIAAVKFEGIQGLMNFHGVAENEKCLSANAWNDTSGFASSSASHLL
ncbi:hypothetical protein Pfo_015362 [Paulownia fortunei]|nr:hypothetical protein Pfo_015362 [Paulownia fortunei]